MQLRLELAESSAPAAALWELVGEQQRQTAMALLTAMIAQTLAPGAVHERAVTALVALRKRARRRVRRSLAAKAIVRLAPARRDRGDPDVAKAVARVERGRKANAIVRRDARRSRPWTSAQTDTDWAHVLADGGRARLHHVAGAG